MGRFGLGPNPPTPPSVSDAEALTSHTAGGAAMADSEFRAYSYIDTVLHDLGWDTRNPRRGGDVFTQHEFHNVDPLLDQALGRQSPENVVRIPWATDFAYWVIEAKAAINDLDLAVKEAQAYANTINEVQTSAARFATGIAGTQDDSFYVSTTYWNDTSWEEVEINNFETTGFLTRSQCLEILNLNSPRILQYTVDNDLFLAKATEINRTLQEYGVAARNRAGLVAGVLLALAGESTLPVSGSTDVLIHDINTRIEALLKKHGRIDVLPALALRPPTGTENHRKYRQAIILTMQHLREMNIRSAINSGTDALGQFYETFLKYANDASEMGIVLTPRHITKFAVDVTGVDRFDRVFDPTCGTGGFLVAALDSIRESHYGVNRNVYDEFRNDGLFGIEQEDDVFGLALVNMIFRGDGKSYIYNGNCFDNQFTLRGDMVERHHSAMSTTTAGTPRPFTRVLMNPPFSVHESESQFVNYALTQLAEDGLLFAILPNGPITGKSDRQWRKRLLEQHTVLAVVRMPDDLFYPTASKGTYALVLRAWRPHDPSASVFFARLFDDNHASGKSKLIGAHEIQDNFGIVASELKRFLATGANDIQSVARELCIAPLEVGGLADFAAEAYLPAPTIASTTRKGAVYGLLTGLADMSSVVSESPSIISVPTTNSFGIEDLFEINRGAVPSLKSLQPGMVPVITTSETRNGIAGYYNIGDELIQDGCVTISANGSGGRAFWHPYAFGASQDVLVCAPYDWVGTDLRVMLYICDRISEEAWRFDYYRKCSEDRLRHDVRIELPVRIEDGEINLDSEAMITAVESSADYAMLRDMMHEH